MSDMQFISNRQLTTFRVPVKSQRLTLARWPQEFLEAYQRSQKLNQPMMILGQGANTLFVEEFKGEIVVNNFLGIKVFVKDDYYQVHVNSGVTIEHLIQYLHRYKIYGLENLSSIPSSIATAVIGNIGAYGLEFESFVEKVYALNLETGEEFELSHAECEFTYRDSVFKHRLSKNIVVLAVDLHIPRSYTPKLTYGPLDTLTPDTPPKEIRALVQETRASKLPDYNVTGNGGSFFINPIVPKSQFLELKERFPQLVSFSSGQTDIVKLSAGWLIENSGLKGFRLGKAQVSPKHALILTNAEQEADGKEIALLASYVQAKVKEVMGVTLVPEIRFIGAEGEINSLEYLEALYSQALELAQKA